MKVTNMTVWLGAIACQDLGRVRLPVATALKVAKLGDKLARLRKPIEDVRLKLVDEYAEKDAAGKTISENGNVKLRDREAFQKAFDELMETEANLGEYQVITLPKSVTSTCDKCHHNMDKPLEIESGILQPLVELVTVEE